MTLTIPQRIDRLFRAVQVVVDRPDTPENQALYHLLDREMDVWGNAYDILRYDPEQLERLFSAPSMLTFDALAQAILDEGHE